MDLLSDEVLLKILVYLDIKTIHSVVLNVSMRWRKLALDPLLNRYIKVDCNEDFEFLEDLPTKHLVSAIEIHGSVYNLTKRIAELISHLSNLRRLVIKSRLNPHALAAISLCCTKLKYLDIWPSNGITIQYLNVIRPLEGVVTRFRLDTVVIQWMAKNCHNLRELQMYSVHEETDSLLLARCHYLTNLRLKNPPGSLFETIIKCINLKELRLYMCVHLNGSNLMSLLTLRQLSVLHITGINDIEKAHFDHFIQALDMPYLTDLSLAASPFSDDNAECLAKKKPPLQQLDLTSCERLKYNGVLFLATHLKHLLILKTTTKLPESVVQEISETNTIRKMGYHNSLGQYCEIIK